LLQQLPTILLEELALQHLCPLMFEFGENEESNENQKYEGRPTGNPNNDTRT
jgi:hypothetical protein